MLNKTLPRWLSWPYLILIHVVLWWITTSLFNRGFDNYGDMVENYAWSQKIDWGTFKHPPLVAWVVHAWFAWMPTTTWSYYLLSWVNVAFTLWGIAALSGLLIGNPALSHAPLRSSEEVKNIKWVAVALASLMFPLSTLASKYNANAVLLPFWPWAAVFLLKSWTTTGWRGILSTLLLALFSALGMLGKYYTGVLLLSFFITSLLHPTGRAWYKTIKPYLAVLSFLVLLLPHLQWVKAHDYITFKYAEEQGDGGVSFKHVVSFALSYYYYAVLLWIVAFGCMLRSKNQSWLSFFKRTLPQKADGILPLSLALMPMMISVLIALSSFVELTAHWAIPIWYALPILAIAKRAQPIDPALLAKLWRAMLLIWILVLLVGAVRAFLTNTTYGQISIPREELAHQVMAEYHTSQIGWVSGMWQEAASLAFYMDSHPRTLPTTPDSKESLIDPLNNWQHMDGLLICTQLPTRYAPQSAYNECQKSTEAWLNAHQQTIDKKEFILPMTNWLGQKNTSMLNTTLYHYHAQN